MRQCSDRVLPVQLLPAVRACVLHAATAVQLHLCRVRALPVRDWHGLLDCVCAVRAVLALPALQRAGEAGPTSGAAFAAIPAAAFTAATAAAVAVARAATVCAVLPLVPSLTAATATTVAGMPSAVSSAAARGAALLFNMQSCLRVRLLRLQQPCAGVLWVRRAG